MHREREPVLKFSINKDALNEAIQHVSKAISSRTTIPILNGIKMDAGDQGLTLTASDTEISIQAFVSAARDGEAVLRLERPGSVVVPAKFFVDIVRKLPEDEVFVDVSELHRIAIRSGSIDIQLAGLDPEEFPQLPELSEDRKFTILSDVLRDMIRLVSFAVSTNEAAPILTGVNWTLEGGRLKFAATDRHRLACVERAIDCPEKLRFQNVVVPGKNLNELYKILPEQNTLIDVVISGNQALFRAQNVLFYSRLLEGTYPEISKIIPNAYKTETVFDTRSLEAAIDRAYLLSREEKTNIVRLSFMDDERTVEVSSSSGEIGRVTEKLAVESFGGEPLKISFNSKYMLDVLRVVDDARIFIGFTGTMSPMVLKPAGDEGALYLILPYRTMN